MVQEALALLQVDWPCLSLPLERWKTKQSAKAGAASRAPVSPSSPAQAGTVPKAEQDVPMPQSSSSTVETTPKEEQIVPEPKAAVTGPPLPPSPAQAGTGQAAPEITSLQFDPKLWKSPSARARAAKGLPPTEVMQGALLASLAASQPAPDDPLTAAAAAPPVQCKPCGSTDVRMKTGVFVDPTPAAPEGQSPAQAGTSSGAAPWRPLPAQAGAAPAAAAIATRKKAVLTPRSEDAPLVEKPPPGTTFHERVPRHLLKQPKKQA